jgi:hypothetical protein
MRRSLAALAFAAAAAILASGCGGGGDDDDEAGGSSTTSTTTREPIDVSTPEAVVQALADAGITCENLVSDGPENLADFGIEGTESHCTIGGDTLDIAIIASDQELSDLHKLFTDFVGFATGADGQPLNEIMWVEVDHTVVAFSDAANDATSLAPIQSALGARIEKVAAVDQPA